MKFLVLSQITTEIPIDRDLELPRIPAEGGHTLVAGPARLRGLARPGARGVEIEATLEATVNLRCSRCIEPYEGRISGEFRLDLVPDAVEAGPDDAEIREQDACLFYAERGKVDLRVIASEQIQLNLPLKPICDPSCLGLCPTCGANRNRIQCDCRQGEVDPRLTPLQRLKDEIDGA